MNDLNGLNAIEESQIGRSERGVGLKHKFQMNY